MKDHDSNATDPLDPADPVNRDSVSDSWGRAAAYDAYADGLHTYALGGLRHHEAASSAVYCAFVAADHHVAHLGDAEMLRPWLYAITRHFCRAGKLPRMRLTASSAPAPASAPKDAAMAELERTLLSAELASLDWPDTDGLSGAHREMLELSVRHGMESRAVGMMLGKPAAESFELLSQAWHELERSLAALALLRTSRRHCPELATLAEGWSGRLTAQRREPLVRHVDACSRCQYHLHKEIGAPQAPSILPHVPAPKALRERVLGDLLDTTGEKAAEKAAIATRLSRFDAFGFPAIATPRPPQPRPRTATPMPVERRPRRLGALLAGRVSSAAAEAVVGEVASAPERLGMSASASPDAKQPANTLTERSGSDDVAVTAGTERRRWLRRASAELDEGPIAPRRGLAAGVGAAGVAGAAGVFEGGTERARGPQGTEVLPGLGAQVRESIAASEPDRSGAPGGSFADAATDFAAQATEVLAALRSEPSESSESASDDTLVNARRPGVFDDVRPVRPLPSRGPVPRNSVAAAVEGRRRGVDEARRGMAPVGDAYEAAAAVAASMAAGDAAGAQVPPIAPVGIMPTAVMPLGMVPGRRAPRDGARGFPRPAGVGAPVGPEPRKRKAGVKSALASSAVLSGVGAAGVTAFVLFAPSAPSGNKALFTPPEPGGNGAQTPDYPRPSSSPDAGPALPVAGNVHTGLPAGDAVTAQVVAAVLPTGVSSSLPGTPGATNGTPVNGPIQLPSQTATSSAPDSGGQLHISVSQRSNDPADVDVTLWNSGTGPVSWTATPDAPWLSLSATSGMLAGGGQTSIHVLVDSSAGPSGPWTAHVRFDPSGQMVSISGDGHGGGSTPSGPPSSSPTGGSSTPSTTPSTPPTSSTPSTPPTSSPSTSRSSASAPSSSGGSDPPSRGPSSPGSPSSPSSGPGTSSPPTTQPSGSGTGTPSGTDASSQPSTTPTGTRTSLPATPHPQH
ncbi:hypothetical protein KGQ20_26310 [Catenulispora sp. NF23]|uniref:BACON domain-containing protein n=1 Tax=Catenulispora pinistramenti TaxID=2705254 RepID=UPI001BAC8AE1|nr:hypothetical protein [Catenulispora pinistramenti]MBS2536283.1 hypothetical protein [Catenulispora pinistramenti]